MKTSNKILTTFLSIIALYFLVFALDLRLFGRHKNNGMFPELNKHIIPIEEFKYIKLENISNLVISPASTDSYEIEIKYSTDTTHFAYLSESMLKRFKPSYSGDTIVLEGSSEQKSLLFRNVRITVPLSTQFISSHDSRFSMEGFELDSLSMVLDNSQLNGSHVSNIKKN